MVGILICAVGPTTCTPANVLSIPDKSKYNTQHLRSGVVFCASGWYRYIAVAVGIQIDLEDSQK